jgi:hypothetical protein
MRRLLFTCLFVLALSAPAAAFALQVDSGDGTLAVRHGAGDPGQVVANLNVSGAVVGHVDSGKVLVLDLSDSSALAPVVTGADAPVRDLPSGATLYAGTNLGFRAIGGHYWIRLIGRGVDLNLVGHGLVQLQGASSVVADGRYSLDGGPWHSMPDSGETFTIGG